MKKIIVAVLPALAGILASAGEATAMASKDVQSPDSTLLRLTGASTMEELDETEIERFEYMFSKPLSINTANRSRLMSCGLFSPYQVASLIDYQAHQGDILSFSELALVDGFSKEFVNLIRDFIILDYTMPGGQSSRKHKNDFDLVAGLNGKGNFSGKLKYVSENRYSASVTYRDELSANVAIYGKKHLGKIIIGDFGARFGQGLALWSGFSLSGVSSISAFCKHPTGISPSWTLSPASALRGLAADFEFGSHSVAAILSASPGKEGGALNINHLSTKGEIGITGSWNKKDGVKVGTDFRHNLSGNDFFGEAVFNGKDKSVSAICGIIRNFSYTSKAAFRASFDQGKAGAVAGLQISEHFLSIEESYKVKDKAHTVKLLEQSSFHVSEHLTIIVRASEKFKSADTPIFRHDLRSDCCFCAGVWNANIRLNCVYGSKLAALTYAEAGYKAEKAALWCRATAFHADTWDDRIYCYERDAPGTFNVPAYYGRGFCLSLTGNLKAGHSRFDMRIAYLNSNRTEKFEIKLQYRLSL